MTGRIAAGLSLALVAAFAAATMTAPAAGGGARATCAALTSLRSLASSRRPVDLRVRRTTIAALVGRSRPAHVVRGASAFERQSFEVVAQIVLVRRTPAGVVRLVLFDDGAYMNATLPPLRCVSAGTPARAAISGARTRYIRGCGLPTPEWQPLGAVAYVRGVGFWGSRRTRGSAPNGAELAPVTSLRFLAGCGAR